MELINPQDKTSRESESRERAHDQMIAMSYGHGVSCGKLTELESKGIRRLAQMIIRGVSFFEASEFGKPLGLSESDSKVLLECLVPKSFERQVTLESGETCWIGGPAARIGTVVHIGTPDGERTVYSFMIDGVPSYFERMRRAMGDRDQWHLEPSCR